MAPTPRGRVAGQVGLRAMFLSAAHPTGALYLAARTPLVAALKRHAEGEPGEPSDAVPLDMNSILSLQVLQVTPCSLDS